MRNIFLGTALFFIGTVLSCTSCSKKEFLPDPLATPTVEIPVLPTVTNTVTNFPLNIFKGEGWEFSAPNGWTSLDTTEPGIDALVISKDNKNLILVAKDECLTDTTICISSVVKELKTNGADVNSVTEVIENDQHYWLIKSSMDNIQVSAWISIVQGKVIIFSCGGPIVSDIETICKQIVKTLRVK